MAKGKSESDPTCLRRGFGKAGKAQTQRGWATGADERLRVGGGLRRRETTHTAEATTIPTRHPIR